MKVVLLIGLPGSGKSTTGKYWSEVFKIPFYDDASHLVKDIKEILDKKEDEIIISDCNLCIPSVLNQAKIIISEYTNEIFIFSFENNKEKCLYNVQQRNDGRKVERMIRLLSKVYKPEGYILDIYKKE